LENKLCQIGVILSHPHWTVEIKLLTAKQEMCCTFHDKIQRDTLSDYLNISSYQLQINRNNKLTAHWTDEDRYLKWPR